MHVVEEKYFENIFEADQTQLFDSLEEDKTTFIVPLSSKHVPYKLGIAEWLSDNVSPLNKEKRTRVQTSWIRVEPRYIEAHFKPFQRTSGKITVHVNAGLGRIVQLLKIVSSSPDFTIKDSGKVLPIISTTKAETVTLEWEIVLPSYEETLVVVYFLGTFNDVHVIHPFKILMTPNDTDLKLGLESFDIKLDDGQVYSQIIWLLNPLRSAAQIENVGSKELITINRPWRIRVF